MRNWPGQHVVNGTLKSNNFAFRMSEDELTVLIFTLDFI